VLLPEPPLVIGYAETATALGHCVADAFAGARYLHSTRREVAGMAPVGTFDEAHSHATEHLLLPADPQWLDTGAPLVLVDDELSTGRTALATIRMLDARRPRHRYVVATLLDLRGDAERAAMARTATELGTAIDVVRLAAGHVELPADILERATSLLGGDESPSAGPSAPLAAVHRLVARWPRALPEGGRHGFGAPARTAFSAAVRRLAGEVARRLPAAGRVLVLGTEELMYAPLRLAAELADQRADPVLFSATTRSPVLALDEPGYAIRTRLVFPAHDGADPMPRFAYNVAPGNAGSRFNAVVLVVDQVADTPALWSDRGLVAQLRPTCDLVLVVVLPALYFPAIPAADLLAGRPALA
jgi:hypothetical protein